MIQNPGSTLFDDYYYAHCCGEPYVRNEKWMNLFRDFAKRIVADTSAKKILDAGCAKGFLVEALREHGADAYGVDISETAIGSAYEIIKPFVRVGSLTEPFTERYDLIVTVEVIEHMPARDADVAIANICAATDDVIFSSSPFDYDEPTHVNVHPPEFWAARFAQHGFYRDCDFDGSFMTPWTVRFRKTPRTLMELVVQYERWNWTARQAELGSRRHAHKVQLELSTRYVDHSAIQNRCDALSAELETRRIELDSMRHEVSLHSLRNASLEEIWQGRAGKLVTALRGCAAFVRRLGGGS
jgi:SAM-dependent methyltransferase